MQSSPKCRPGPCGAAGDPSDHAHRDGGGPLNQSRLSGLLAPAAWAYGVAVEARNGLYNQGWLRAHRLGVPVLCVGNLTTGGTGKTPLVAWLCRGLLRRGRRPAILTRGYQAPHGADCDEVRLLRDWLPDTPIVVDADRVRGGRRALEQYQPDVLVLDDGFQHRRLARDLDLVLIDCLQPFGGGALLPQGRLREPLHQLRRADVVILTRSDQVPPEELIRLRQRVRDVLDAPADKLVACARQIPTASLSADGAEQPVEALRGRRVFAFCGIGNPQSFIRLVAALGADVVDQQCLEDHHHYRRGELERWADRARASGAEWLITTEKDWVKLRNLPAAWQTPALHWLRVETVLTQGEPDLWQRVERVIPPTGGGLGRHAPTR